MKYKINIDELWNEKEGETRFHDFWIINSRATILRSGINFSRFYLIIRQDLMEEVVMVVIKVIQR